ncbi:C40 family peptidase [Robiginitomaculum antarcticum]|uniref:C40 family peptidase n=1 Tax=Robiginitomaculum antarcticum TaxID=437507 RepID=UPI00039A4724|nr:SH3 domain-containing protein [Robiginitomaculum antarcticum]
MTLRILCAAFITAAISYGCASTVTPPSALEFDDPFVSDVIGVTEKHLAPDYWITPGMDKTLMSEAEIKAFNAANTKTEKYLYDIKSEPQTLSKTELTEHLRSISKKPGYPRIYTDGIELTDADFARYESQLNLDAIGDTNPVRYALAVRRTSIRTYPTFDLLFSHDATDRDIERFQESALFPGDALRVLHESTDGQWALIQSYNYIAWVPLADIAMGRRDQVFSYGDTDNFLIITGDKVLTVFNPELPAVSELQLDMGVKVPLSRPDSLKANLYGQNPYLSHMVLLPIRKTDGTLEFKHALIQRNQDVHVGYLPYTEANIIRQAFKFLGERYGWGHRFNGRDCTGFVSEIYQTFGIKLPRNSSDQRDSNIGVNDRFERGGDHASKVTRLNTAKVGDLVYIPGHVLMVLGQSGGEPFAIHDVHGMRYKNPDGSLYEGTLNGVSVTPITPLQFNSDESYIDRILAVKTIR